MYLIIYVSTATKHFSDEELASLLEESRAWNEKEELTGLLLYKEGSFMQFLEGPRDNVLFIMEKIRTDPRHHGVIVLLQEEHWEREFSNWSMAYKKVDQDVPLEIPGYSDYLELPVTSEKFLTNPTKTLELLLGFKKTLALSVTP
jgi:uncharacterized Fe-S cluster-containing MiaB family protein